MRLLKKFTYNIFRKHTAGQVSDVFVLTVDDFCQLPSLDHLLKHVHRHFTHELIRPCQHIVADDLRYDRTPEDEKTPTPKMSKIIISVYGF